MRFFDVRSLNTVVLMGFSVFLVNCSHNSSSSPPPAVEEANGSNVTNPYSITRVANFGKSSSDNLIHFELDGQFSGASDIVTVSCAGGATPTLAITSDAQAVIQLTLSPTDDSCTFSVQSPDGSAAVSSAVSVSSTQVAINIPSLSLSIDRTDSTQTVVYLLGLNFDPSQLQVFESCDGAPYSAQLQSGIKQDSFIIPDISFSIANPQSSATCKFYLTANGVQSSVIANYWLQSASQMGLNLNLSGSFMGATDTVHIQCPNEDEQVISGSDLTTDSTTQIQLSVSSTMTSACTVSVSADGLQSKTINLLSMFIPLEI